MSIRKLTCACKSYTNLLFKLRLGHQELINSDLCALKEGVEARFEVKAERGGDRSTVETKVVKAKLLVGSDGVWSRVRELVVGDEPRDLWLITWLAIVPTDSIR